MLAFQEQIILKLKSALKQTFLSSCQARSSSLISVSFPLCWGVTFDFSSPHLNTNVRVFSTLNLQKRLVPLVWKPLREIIDYFYFCIIPCHLPNISRNDFNLSEHITRHGRRKKKKKMETDSGTERKGLLMSCICRDPAAFCLDILIFSLCCCSGHFTNPKCVYLTSWEWDSTIKYSIFVVRSGTTGINHMSFNQFNHKYPPDGDFLLWVHFRACILLLLLE